MSSLIFKLVAMVGDNGAGKSTIINVLTRTYDVTEGEILINGVQIKVRKKFGNTGQEIVLTHVITIVGQNFATSDLQKQMVVLFQYNRKIPQLSIADFISLDSSKDNMESVLDAAKQAGCHDFIMRTPAGK